MDTMELIMLWAKKNYDIELTEEDAVGVLLYYAHELEIQFPVSKQDRLFDKAFRKFLMSRTKKLLEFSLN